MAILWRTLVNAVAIAAAAYVVPGIHWGQVDYGMGDTGRYLSLALTGLALGLVNAIVRPILALVAMPITCLTVIPFLGFSIDGFLPALIGSIVISIVSFVLSRVLPD